MNKFRRRTYENLAHFWQDMRWPIKNRDKIRQAMRGDQVSFAFRERLMLSVTQVNGCRYCVYYHTKEALKAGLSEPEMRALLQGTVDDAPSDEIPALLYAQHWAESEGKPDPIAQEKLMATYGQERGEAIETVLHMIQTGNLLGNLWDYALFRVSFGQKGLSSAEKALSG